jgi:hypothetical protein
MLAPTSRTAPAVRSDEYRRRARQLRARHSHDLGALHQALGALAQESNSTVATAPKVEGPAIGFAQLVAQQLQGPVLRYSHRIALVQEAQKRGIARFEANLIIAAVQHQTNRRPRVRTVRATHEGFRISHAILAACAVQGTIFLAMYLLLCG